MMNQPISILPFLNFEYSMRLCIIHALQKKYFTAILSTTTVQVDCLRCEAELLYTFCIVISGQYLVVSQRVFISGAIVSVTHKGDFYVFINDLQSWIF